MNRLLPRRPNLHNIVMKFLKVSLLIGAFIPAVYLQAQPLVTPGEAIATALQNNYDIRLSRNDSLISAIDYSYANAAFLPTLFANGGYIRNKNDQSQKLADGSDRKRNGIISSNVNAAVELEWILYDGLRMFATRDRLRELVRLGDLTIKSQVTDIVANVLVTYYNIVRQKQQLKAIEEQMVINRERLNLAEVRLQAGLGIKPEVLQAKVDLNAQIAAQFRQQTLIAQQKINLNRLMAIDTSINYEVLDSIPIDTTLTLGGVRENIVDQSPAVLLARKNVDISNIILRERRGERLPIVSFNSAYNFSRTNNSSVVNPFSPLYNLNKGFNYGFTATIPIFNNYLARRNVRQAQADIRFRQLSLENEVSLLQTNVENSYKSYELQKKALALEESNISLAKENVAIAFERYKLGVTTFVELRDAQQSLQLAYDRLIAARFDTKVAETELHRLRGDFVFKQ